MNFDGQAGIVTGGTAGIGRAIALDLAAKGARVLITGRNAERGVQVASEARERAGEVQFFAADMSDPNAPQQIVETAQSIFGRVDFLVNNAGILVHGAAPDFTDEVWNNLIDINVSSVFRMSRAALHVLQKAGGGRIVNVASDWALMGAKGSLAYCVSKAAVAQMTRCMALDHAREGIRVNAVCPGDTDTSMINLEHESKTREERLNLLGEAIPLGRIAQADEIAKVVSFLLSDDSSFMTGALVPVDGGNSAQ